MKSTCNGSNHACEDHEWPSYPTPELEGVDEKELLEMDILLTEGTSPDGYSPEEREDLAHVAQRGHPYCGMVAEKMTPANASSSRQQTSIFLQYMQIQACWTQISHNVPLQGFEETLLTQVQSLGDPNCLYAKLALWRDANAMLVPTIPHLFWYQLRSFKKLQKAQDLHC